MSIMAFQTKGNSTVCSTVCSRQPRQKQQNSTLLAVCYGNIRWIPLTRISNAENVPYDMTSFVSHPNISDAPRHRQYATYCKNAWNVQLRGDHYQYNDIDILLFFFLIIYHYHYHYRYIIIGIRISISVSILHIVIIIILVSIPIWLVSALKTHSGTLPISNPTLPWTPEPIFTKLPNVLPPDRTKSRPRDWAL